MMVLMFCFMTCLYSHDSARELFEQGAFQECYDAYSALSVQEPLDMYAYGSAAYKLGRNAEAVIWWKRSQLAWGIAGVYSVQQALDILQGQQTSTGQKLWMFIQYSPVWCWQLLILLLLLLIALSGRMKLSGNTALIIYTFFGITSLVLSYRYVYDSQISSVVVREEVIHSGPGAQFARVGKLNSCEIVTLIESKETGAGTYHRFITTKGRGGWIIDTALTSI